MERKVTLVQVEVSGIQGYLFGSNNLRQNIGASERVARATTEQVITVLTESLQVPHNVRWEEETVKYHRLLSLDAGQVQAEVIYAGGGNALLLFEGGYEGHPRAFVRALTTWALQEAPGLTLLTDAVEFDWWGAALSACHNDLRRQLTERKAGAVRPTPLLGLGVTADCDFTGLPAVGRDADGRLIARSVQQKVALTLTKEDEEPSAADRRLARVIPAEIQEKYEIVRNFDQFGERGESSYIAVVHVDGNGMHKRFEAIVAAHPTSQDNPAYVRTLRALSKAINERAEEALRSTVALLHASRDKENKFGGVVPVPQRDGQDYLPFRPLVFGGDDTTFVCEGRLGLALTAYYLKQLGTGTLPGPREGTEGDPLYARGGVAIVKSHYPFSRAYELADALASSAKRALNAPRSGGQGIVLDWHVSTAGAILDLGAIRARDYQAANEHHSLLMRPLWLTPPGSDPWRTWENFETVTSAFQKDEHPLRHTPEGADPSQNGELWPRNKLMALRAALREGEKAVAAFRTNYGVEKLPKVEHLAAQEGGWSGGDCPYFDPIEATDFLCRLRKE